MNNILLCTDMDRTIIPNGRQTEHQKARTIFGRLCNMPELRLAYVTGRHLQLVKDAIDEYRLPVPDYVITDVGTKIYEQKDNYWQEMTPWQEKIAKDWRGKTHAQIKELLTIFPALQPQEESKQNDYKLSYYLHLDADHGRIARDVQKKLLQFDVDASLVISIDEEAELGLLDILPQNGTKLHAILFLQQQLGYDLTRTIFAGDSGNDLLVLGSHVPSILVANAHADIQNQAEQLAVEKGNEKLYYLADDDSFILGGNYSAGVVQGVLHYLPEVRKRLDLT